MQLWGVGQEKEGGQGAGKMKQDPERVKKTAADGNSLWNKGKGDRKKKKSQPKAEFGLGLEKKLRRGGGN